VRIAVVGAGAMGSVYTGLLAAGGHDVTAVDVDAEHVAAIRERGLRVEGASGDRVVRVAATTDPEEVGPVDLVVVATKSMAARAAAESARPLLDSDTTVLTIQNGLGAADEVAGAVGESRVLVGIAGGFGASLVAPGHAHHHGMEIVRLGELRGAATERTERVAEAWRQAGFTVEALDDVRQLLWKKLICNACYAAVGGLLELTIGGVLENQHAWTVGVRCAQEALDVGRARAVELDIPDCEAYVRDYGLAIPDAQPSLLLDLLAGKPTEVEWINGSVVREGALAGIPAPTNELVTALVLAKQAR
jgi:2-dehydropantoate 2-reductase